MNAKRCLLFAMILALLLPATVVAAPNGFSRVSGTVQFAGDGVDKQFDPRIGPYYAMPTSGGEVTLRVGVYSGMPTFVNPTDDVLEAFATDGQPPATTVEFPLPYEKRPISWVRVRIYDRDDPSRVLYEFEGNMEAFLSQPDIEVKFSGPYNALITKSVTVPPAVGATWWVGQLENYAGVTRGHCNVNLIQGGLQAWVDAHQGFW